MIFGKPVPTSDQVRGRLFPQHAPTGTALRCTIEPRQASCKRPYLSMFQDIRIDGRFLTRHNPTSMVRAASGGGPAAIAEEPRVSKAMSDGTRENGESDPAHTDEAALSARLRRLGEGLGRARGRAGEPSGGRDEDRATTASGYARGFRLSSEFVAGVAVGAGIGWLLDRWLGTSPWGLIVFVLLGFAAGVLNVMHSAGMAADGMTGEGGSPPGVEK